jgi:hypothetical protein
MVGTLVRLGSPPRASWARENRAPRARQAVKPTNLTALRCRQRCASLIRWLPGPAPERVKGKSRHAPERVAGRLLDPCGNSSWARLNCQPSALGPSPPSQNRNLLHLVERDLVRAPVVELGGARRGVVGERLRVLAQAAPCATPSGASAPALKLQKSILAAVRSASIHRFCG